MKKIQDLTKDFGFFVIYIHEDNEVLIKHTTLWHTLVQERM